MLSNDANQFAFDSFVTAFEPGNEHLIEQYFDSDLMFVNHSIAKRFSLSELKSRLPNVHKKYQDLKSEISDVIVENDRIAFHVTQNAFYAPENKRVTVDVMNLYKLSNGKVKEWQIWENFNKGTIGESNLKNAG